MALVCQKQSPCSGLLHTSPQRSETCEQDLHSKLQQGASTDKEHSSCVQVSFSPARLCSTGDASKFFVLPAISLEIPGASTCTGQGPLPPFSCKQCLGGQKISSKELHNIHPNATCLGDTFLRLGSFPPLPAPKSCQKAGRKPFFLFYKTATEIVRLR